MLILGIMNIKNDNMIEKFLGDAKSYAFGWILCIIVMVPLFFILFAPKFAEGIMQLRVNTLIKNNVCGSEDDFKLKVGFEYFVLRLFLWSISITVWASLLYTWHKNGYDAGIFTF